jgi:phosphate transport system permease protein
MTENMHMREHFIRSVWFCAALISAAAVFFILGYLIITALPAVTQISLLDTDWNPAGLVPSYGIAALVTDTLLVTLGALLFAAPLGLASAVYLSYLAPPKVRDVVKPVIELLAGIPSVVYGFFGMVVLCGFLTSVLDIPSGFSWLAASVLLGIMALPTIVSVSEDAMSAVPKDYREASLGLGATGWQTVSRVLLPAAASGISAAVVLGMGRAIGETMAVMMVAGNAAVIPEPVWNVLSPVRTMTATLGIETGEVAAGSMHYYALFGVATVLLAITLIVNLASAAVIRRMQSKTLKRSYVTHAQKRFMKNICYAGIYFSLSVFIAVSAGLLSAVVFGVFVPVWYVIRRKVPAKLSEKTMFGIIYLCTGFVIFLPAVILSDIFSNGLPAISWEFLTGYPEDLGRGGGIYPAIAGTLQLVAGAVILALPAGIGTAIYLTEYSGNNPLTKLLRTGNDLLNGTPSIVFGLFGFAFFVIFLDWGICLLAGQICLAVMILPVIIRTSEEALKSVPDSLREASLGLGATKWQTIRNAVLPVAAPGILTGTILSVGRAAGETAPIMFTAVVFTKRFLTLDLFDPVMALPFHLYLLSTAVPDAEAQQYGTAVVLIVLVTGIYLAAILLRRHFHNSLRYV